MSRLTSRRGALTLNLPIVVAGLIGGAATASGIALTTSSGWLIVRASERPQILTLITIIVGVRTFGLGRPLFRYWERLRSHDEAFRDLADRRAETYAELVPLTPARLGKRGRADLLTGVVDDLTDVVEASVRVTVPLVGALAAGLLAAALTALVSPAVGLVLAGMLLAGALLVWISWRLEARSQDELLAARAEVARVSHLSTSHTRELAAVGGVDTAKGWVRAAHTSRRAAIDRQSRGRALAAGTALVITGLGTLASAAIAVGTDSSIAMKGLLVLAPVATGEALGVIADATRALARAQGSQRRLAHLLDQTPAVRDHDGTTSDDPTPSSVPAPMTSAPRIELVDLTAGWAPGRTDTGPVTTTIEPGERVAVVGPNGAGKSTLLAVLARHLDPSAGRYLVDGVDVTTRPLEEVRSLVAVVDDEPHVFSSTLRENLRLAAPGGTGDDALLAALRAAGLGPWFATLAEGLETRLGADGVGVSGGERARLSIARALASGRPVVLLDEPVAHLDHPTATAVLSDLLATGQDRTLVMVTHHAIGVDGFGRTLDMTKVKVG